MKINIMDEDFEILDLNPNKKDDYKILNRLFKIQRAMQRSYDHLENIEAEEDDEKKSQQQAKLIKRAFELRHEMFTILLPEMEITKEKIDDLGIAGEVLIQFLNEYAQKKTQKLVEIQKKKLTK